MVLTRSAVILPSASNAISAWVTWSRPCASVRNASERSRHPFHRPADLARRPQADDLLRIDEDLRAEAAAHVGRDHAQLVLGRHADEGGDHQPRDMRVLRRVPQREAVGAGIVFADGGARLDRIRNEAVVDDIELGDVLGRLERGVGRLGVAEMPLVDRVVGRDFVDLRRARALRLGRIGDRRQHLVFDLDLLGRRPSPAPTSRRRRRRPRRRHNSPCRARSPDAAPSSSASRPWSGSSSRR